MVKAGLFFLTSEPPAKRTVISTVVTSPNLLRLAIRASSALDLTLLIYSYEIVGTGSA